MNRWFSGLSLAVLLAGGAARADYWDSGDRIRGEGPVEKERREVKGIDAVDLGTIGTLFIDQADSTSLYVVAEKNLLEYLETHVRGGMLTIRTRKHVNLSPSEPIEFHLTVPRLEEVILSSSGDGVLSDWHAERLFLELESSGDLDLGALVCPDLDIQLESSGDLTLESWQGTKLNARLESSGDCKIRGGTAHEIDVEIESSGDFSAAELECKDATVSTSSSGDAVLRVTDYLLARSSSSGDVMYYGDPEVDSRATSSGDIVHRGI
jgi:hypothetical protein